MPASLLEFARFLRARRTDLLADWRDAVLAAPRGARSDASDRATAVDAWLQFLTALAEGQPGTAARALTHAYGDTHALNRTALRDVSLLHRLISRRAHDEHVECGAQEFEFLWSALDRALDGSILTELEGDADPQRRSALSNLPATAAQRERFPGEASRLPPESLDYARLYEDAQRAVHAREQVLAIVTHDLRAPLSAVVTGASLLMSVDSVQPDGSRIRRRGETIQRAAQHMSRLVNDLTDLAQIDAGRLTIDRKLEDPADVVREVLDALEPVVARRGGTLRARLSGTLPRVSLDRDRLRQVLANLAGNANKVGASEIAIGIDVRDAELVFSVADNGPGIPPEDLLHIFDRHFRASGTPYKGSGLGLPISNGIVKAHGGRMWIESTVGAGTTFFFSLPR